MVAAMLVEVDFVAVEVVEVVEVVIVVVLVVV